MTGADIRLLHTPEEMLHAEALQQAVWPGEAVEIVPAHVLLTAAHNGGQVVGAFLGSILVGFTWGFLGLDGRVSPPRVKLCSHQLGVLPAWRGAGIGRALKRFQRRFCLAQGIDLITWTYDPLLARNAQLNIAGLGAVCDTYLPDLYGPLRDGLNAGLPSDRFQVDWWINTPRVAERLAAPRRTDGLAEWLAAGARLVNPPDRQPPALSINAPATGAILVEIPADLLALKAADPALALRWRLGARAVFAEMFAQGYGVTDFVRDPGRAAYVLSRERPTPQENTHAH